MNVYDAYGENELTKDTESSFDFSNLSTTELDTLVQYLTAAKNGKALFDGEQREKIQEICDRYAKYGVTINQCEFIVASGLNHGFDFEKSLLGLRLGLSIEYRTHEYFTSADVSRMTGETPEQIDRYIQEHEDELYNSGQIAKVTFIPPKQP